MGSFSIIGIVAGAIGAAVIGIGLARGWIKKKHLKRAAGRALEILETAEQQPEVLTQLRRAYDILVEAGVDQLPEKGFKGDLQEAYKALRAILNTYRDGEPALVLKDIQGVRQILENVRVQVGVSKPKGD